ncbi:MAG: hypothetical protein NC205_06340 [Prevotella sp.]|nr:hypothetical protein [Alistipes senegalensis]MCM1358196.1 hypothetical protein [Prevotella sp.]MCM1473073.1 hypothetical protein [Muribaculaceae bacterium]
MNDENEKVYTLKSVQSEITKLEKSRLKKKEKISNLTAELKADNVKMKELEKIYDELYHDDLQQKIAKLWFKEEKMTKEQIEKFLELSKNIHDKIDVLDVQTIVNAVTYAYNKQRNEAENSANANAVSKML